MKRLGLSSTIATIGLATLMGALVIVSPARALELDVAFFSGDYVGAVNGYDVIEGGIPDYGGDKEGFISFVKGKLRNGGANSHDHIGAAFIVYTMLGYEPGNDKNGPSSEEIADWERRIRNPRITIQTRNINSGINSMVFPDGGSYDAKFFSEGVSGPSLVFKYDGWQDVYFLRLACANPVGDTPGLPEVAEWDVNGQSYAKIGSGGTRRQGEDAITAKPGDRVYWDHTLRNTGPDTMDRDVEHWIQRQDRSIESGREISFSEDGADWDGDGARNGSTFYNDSTNHTITQDDVGEKLCQRIAWEDRAWDEFGVTGYSGWACVNVPYNYGLIPSIQNGLVESIPEGEQTIRVDVTTPKIDNSGPTKSRGTKNAVVRFVVRDDPEAKFLPAGDGVTRGGSNWACDVTQEIGNRNTVSVDTGTCKTLSSESDEVLMPGGKSFTLNEDDISDLGDLAIGDRVCYTVIVSSYTQDVGDSTFRYSESVCVRVAKKPKVQILGADVRIGGDSTSDPASNVRTSNSQRNGKLYGSWAEYGMFAPGTITSASGAGLSGAEGRDLPAVPANYNALTFANTPQFGRFGVMPRTTLSPEYNNMAGSSDDITIGGADAPGVIKTTGTVTIAENIIHDEAAEHTSIANLPQHVIIAKNIIINANVTRVDAWLISQDGYISTCDVVPNMADPLAGLTADICNQQLRINGPVIADQLFLRRTAGSGRDDPGSPAEIINVRPDVYLWAYGRSMDISAIKTSYIRELPPRF